MSISGSHGTFHEIPCSWFVRVCVFDVDHEESESTWPATKQGVYYHFQTGALEED